MTEENTTAVSRIDLPKPKRPPGRPPKHGAFSGAELAIITPMKEHEIREVLTGAKVIVGKGDSVVILSLARVLAKVELMDRFFAACGLFDDENKLRQGDMKVYLAAINAAGRLCDMLGLTPQSRVRLGIGLIQAQKDLGSLMSESEEDPR